MKGIITKVFTFAIFAVLFSLLTGCGGVAGNQAVSNNASAPGNSNAPAAANSAKKNSEYPPLAEKAANAEMKNLDGTMTKVTDRKGKVLLLNMWATWCGPCRGEMPALVKMQEEHGPKGFEIIGLSSEGAASAAVKVRLSELFSEPRCCRCFEISST